MGHLDGVAIDPSHVAYYTVTHAPITPGINRRLRRSEWTAETNHQSHLFRSDLICCIPFTNIHTIPYSQTVDMSEGSCWLLDGVGVDTLGIII